MIGSNIIYTSAHLLKNDIGGYMIIQSGTKIPLKVLLRDRMTDEAFLTRSELSEKEVSEFLRDFREDITNRREKLSP